MLFGDDEAREDGTSRKGLIKGEIDAFKSFSGGDFILGALLLIAGALLMSAMPIIGMGLMVMGVIGFLGKGMAEGLSLTQKLPNGKEIVPAGKPRDGNAPDVSHNVARHAPSKETGFVATVKDWMGAASDYVVDKWEHVTNSFRSNPKPYSRVLAYTDNLNLPALEQQHHLPAGLLSAVMHHESSGNRYAVSGAGAEGLFQFMPATGRDYGLKTQQDRFDPAKSAKAAAEYLENLSQQFNGHVPSMLAAYNWGQDRVAKFNSDKTYVGKDGKVHAYTPPPDTQKYVADIMSVLPAYQSETIRIAAAKSDTRVASNEGSLSPKAEADAAIAKARAQAATSVKPGTEGALQAGGGTTVAQADTTQALTGVTPVDRRKATPAGAPIG